MSSAGQIVGGVVGAVVGFMVGGPTGALYGAQIGMGVGGYIDPPDGPKLQGPRLNDLSVQTSTYGAAIPRIYGTVALNGNVFWLENNALKEVATTEEQGGKGGGGGGAEVTTYAYYATFAVGLCEGPIAGVRRIWIGSKLIYDADAQVKPWETEAGGMLRRMIANYEAAPKFTVHLGTEGQEPDERMQATLGVANTPAYRGLAYIVFKDYPLKDHGNSLLGAQVRVEVMKAATPVPKTVLMSVAQNDTWTPENFWLVGGEPHFGKDEDLVSAGVVTHYRTSRVVGGDGKWLTTSVNTYTTTLAAGAPIFSKAIRGADAWFALLGYTGSNYGWIVDGELLPGIANPGGLSTPNEAVYAYGKVFFRFDIHGDPLGHLYRAELGATSFDAVFGKSVYPIYRKLFTDYAGNLIGQNYADGKLYQLDADLNVIDGPWEVTSGVGLTPFGRDGDDWYFTDNYYSSAARVHRIPANGGYTLNEANRTEHWFYGANGPDFIAYVGSGTVIAVINISGTKKIEAITLTPLEGDADTTLSDVITTEVKSSNLLTAADIDVTGLLGTVRGYRVGSVAAIRSALEPLQGAWPFDVVQSGYQIKFRPRGQSSVATIPAAMLDARKSGEAPGVEITNAREMDSVLPRRVTLKYLDTSREYDIGEQYAERLNTDAINIRDLELPLVMTGTEAAQTAERLLYLYWMERYDLSFRLPPAYLGLEPGDVITIEADDATYELRLTAVTYTPDGRLECQAKYNAAATYVSTAVGEDGQSTGSRVTLAGGSLYELLDIPTLRDSDDVPGFPVAMSGYLSDWPGGVLYRTDDSGQTWTDLQGFTAPGATIGYATNSIGAGRFDIIDTASALSVRLYSGDLSSVTELAMLNGANHFAYGQHGRWEIIAAQNCVLQGDGSYVLTNLLRGRFGTEWAASQHAANDKVVLLNPARLAFVGATLNSIGLSRTYRGITGGQTLDSAPDRAFTYEGVNLECLSPVYLNGNRHPSTNDWTLTWIRRTRVGGEWRSYVDATLGEASESYEVEIYDGSGYSTVKRTIAASTPSVTYTSADQVADFGGNQTTLYVKVYQLSANVGRGYPLTTSISR